MALWLVRAGGNGEYEQRFLDDNRIYITWQALNQDLTPANSREDIKAILRKTHPHFSEKKVIGHAGQLWAFVSDMEKGNWVILPGKKRPVIHVAEITGPCVFDPGGEPCYYHYRDVRWIETDIPRSNFDQDLLYSFGAYMTICQIKKNDAEKRVRSMAKTEWKEPGVVEPGKTKNGNEEDSGETIDLERIAKDEIAKLIIAKFKGHGLARLVDAILRAQGYTTHMSPPGPDKGVDILAAQGPLGFGRPRICVQVKSGASPVDHPALSQLIGTMQSVQADQGLFVSWGGFKTSVEKEVPAQFFRVRLWNQDTLIEELLAHYHELDDDLKADLPLKRIWAVAEADESEA